MRSSHSSRTAALTRCMSNSCKTKAGWLMLRKCTFAKASSRVFVARLSTETISLRLGRDQEAIDLLMNDPDSPQSRKELLSYVLDNIWKCVSFGLTSTLSDDTSQRSRVRALLSLAPKNTENLPSNMLTEVSAIAQTCPACAEYIITVLSSSYFARSSNAIKM
jgi:hypothetical protein